MKDINERINSSKNQCKENQPKVENSLNLIILDNSTKEQLKLSSSILPKYLFRLNLINEESLINKYRYYIQ